MRCPCKRAEGKDGAEEALADVEKQIANIHLAAERQQAAEKAAQARAEAEARAEQARQRKMALDRARRAMQKRAEAAKQIDAALAEVAKHTALYHEACDAQCKALEAAGEGDNFRLRARYGYAANNVEYAFQSAIVDDAPGYKWIYGKRQTLSEHDGHVKQYNEEHDNLTGR